MKKGILILLGICVIAICGVGSVARAECDSLFDDTVIPENAISAIEQGTPDEESLLYGAMENSLADCLCEGFQLANDAPCYQESCAVKEDDTDSSCQCIGETSDVVTAESTGEISEEESNTEEPAIAEVDWTDIFGTRNLRRVASREIKNLQIYLNAYENKLAGNTLDAEGGLFTNGVFTLSTENAVKKFQRENGLKEDGVVGDDTKAKLVEVMGNLFD